MEALKTHIFIADSSRCCPHGAGARFSAVELMLTSSHSLNKAPAINGITFPVILNLHIFKASICILRSLFVFVFLFPSLGFSEELSLENVLEKAKTYWTPRLGESQINSEASLQQAKNSFLPDINGNVTFRKSYLVSPSGDTQGSASVGASQNILNVSNLMTIGSSKMDAVAQACQTESDQLDVSRNVIGLFFAVIGNMDEDRLQIKRSSMIEKARNLLQETTKLKLSSQSDLFQAEAQVYQIDIQRAQIAADKVAALNQLRTQLGVSPKEQLMLKNDFLDQDIDVTQWSQWADYIPSVLTLKNRVLAASKEIDAIQWELFPAIGASASYDRPVMGLPGDSDSISVLGTVNVPFFDQGSRQVRVKRNKRLFSIYENLYQTKKNEVSNQIAALIIQKKSDQIALEKAAQQMDISEKAYKGAWTLLSLGKNDYFNIQNAQDVNINAERQWLQIRRRLDLTTANLQLLLEASDRIKNKKSSCTSL